MAKPLVWITMIATLASCTPTQRYGSSGKSADTGIRSYVKALRADDAKAAYAMLTDQAKKEISYEEFEVVWREHKGERLDQAKRLEDELRGEPDLGERAQVRYAEGKSVSMIRENGGWRLESGLVSRSNAKRPIDAVRILAEALSSRDYDALMRILTDRRRNAISRQVDSFSTTLVEHLADEINLIGPDRAELTWETDSMRYKVVLRKESQQWRVDDVHIRPKRAAP